MRSQARLKAMDSRSITMDARDGRCFLWSSPALESKSAEARRLEADEVEPGV